MTDEEQLEVYRAVLDLVKSRTHKAKSFGKKSKILEDIDIDELKNNIVDKINNKED